jgi:hypothetical protein
MDDITLILLNLIGAISSVVFIALAVGLYILPTIVAYRRKKRNWIHIAFWNILFGWTVIAWGAMIVEAFKSDDAP